ncbi:MAG: thioredoxin family protein [Armatimonadota bacterium]
MDLLRASIVLSVLICLIMVLAASLKAPGPQSPSPSAILGTLQASSASAPSREIAYSPLPKAYQTAGPVPKIPTGSGKPCLLVFASPKAQESLPVLSMLADLAPRIEPKVELVRIDPVQYPKGLERWKLKHTPTLVLLTPSGKELQRLEGQVSREVLLEALAKADIKPL